MGMKKLFDIYLISEDNRPFLKIETNGRIYKKPFNPHEHPDKQCLAFTKEVAETEEMIKMHESDSFEDCWTAKLGNLYFL